MRLGLDLYGVAITADLPEDRIGNGVLAMLEGPGVSPGAQVLVYFHGVEVARVELAQEAVAQDPGEPELPEAPEPEGEGQRPAALEEVRLVRVIDGDTLVVEDASGDQETVRLVGIDTPELNVGKGLPPEMGSMEAKSKLEELAGPKGSPLHLERSKDPDRATDVYGRTLAVVFRGNLNLNRAMVRSEHARLYYLEHERYFNEHDLAAWTELSPSDLKSKSAQNDPSDTVAWSEAVDNRLLVRGNPKEMPGEIWIGDCRLQVPPLGIRVQQSSTSARISPLRSKGSIQSSSGHGFIRIEIDLFFHGRDQINGYEVRREEWEDAAGRHAVELPYPYHLDGLRSLVAQFKTFPFLPIRNRFLNHVMGIDAVALQNLAVRTVPGFPGVLQATLQLTRFDLSAYVYEEEDLSELIHWPLFRWHVQQKLLLPEQKERRGGTTLWPIPARGLSDEILFGFVPSELADEYGLLDENVVDRADNVLEEMEKAQSILRGLDGVARNNWEPRNFSQKKYANALTLIEALDEYDDWKAGRRAEKTPLLAGPGIPPYVPGVYVYEGYPTPEGPRDVFILPLYDVEELYPDEDDAFEEITIPLRNPAPRKFYAVDLKDAAVLMRIRDSWVAYRDHLERAAFLSEDDLKTLTYPIQGLRLVGLEASLANVLTSIQMDAHEMPTHQYLGSLDTYLRLTFETTSEEAVERLQRLMEYSRALARQVREGITAGFLTIRNDLARLLGVSAILIEDVQVETVAGQPGVYRVEVLAFDFQRTQKDIEAFETLVGEPEGDQGASGTEHLERISTPGNLSWPVIQEKMREIEVYPDMELPTYEELGSFLARAGVRLDIPDHRGKYVDPDFFIKTTHRLTQSLKKVLDNPVSMHLAGKEGETWEADMTPGDPGPSGPEQPPEVPEDLKVRTEQATLMSFQRLADGRLHFALSVAGVPALSVDLGTDQVGDSLLKSLGSERQGEPRVPVQVMLNSRYEVLWVGLSPDEEAKGPSPTQKHSPQPKSPVDAFAGGHFDMMFKHDKRGRLVRAFPAFAFFLVDEGQNVGTRRLFDSLYGLGSVLSVDVTKSRERAADLCVITFTDTYRQLHRRRGEPSFDPTTVAQQGGPGFGPIRPSDQMLKARREPDRALEVRPGARMHLRLGYGSDASAFDTTFNGTVAEIQLGDVMTLACQSDGVELANFPEDPNLARGVHTEEPRNGIMNLLLAHDSPLKTLIRNWSGGMYFNEPANGIAHFGKNALPDATTWEEILKSLGLPVGVGGAGAALGTSAGGLAASLGAPGAIATGAAVGGALAGGIAAAALTGGAAAAYNSIQDMLRNIRTGRPWIEGELGDNVYAGNGMGAFNKIPPDAYGWSWWFRLALSPTDTLTEYDELNLSVQADGMSMWDIIQTYAMATPDYIAAASPVELRSTLFFGKPYFGVAYDYQDGYEPLGEDTSPEEREAHRRRHLKRRPYTQFYYVDHITDIVKNGLVASKDMVFTNVDAVYSDHTGQSSIMVHADTDIKPEEQKTVTVMVPLVAKPLGDGRLAAIARAIMNLAGIGDMDVLGLVEGLFSRPAINNFAVSVLQDYLRNMYQGQLLVMGMPSIKPWDLVHIYDAHNEMFGPVQVRSVTTSLSVETGMLTTIVPDACVYADDPYLPAWAIWGTNVAMGLAIEASAYSLYRSGVLQAWVRRAIEHLPKEVAEELFKAVREGKLAERWASLRARAGSALDDLVADARRVAASVGSSSKNLGRIGSWAARAGKTAAEAAPEIVARLGKNALLKGLLKVVGAYVVAEGISVVAQAGLNSLARSLKNRQAVTMVLLTWRGSEFSAGIDGHKGLVKGDTIGVMDEWIDRLSFGFVDYGETRAERQQAVSSATSSNAGSLTPDEGGAAP